jgi:hypothetical protein
MRYLLGVAAAAALLMGAGSAGAAVAMKPAGLTAAVVDLGSLELVAKRGHGGLFCVYCPIPVPLMSKNCVGTMQSCMAANPFCYVGACNASPVAAAPAKAKAKGKAKKGGKAKGKAKAKAKK